MNRLRLPAEWEPQDGVLLAWPHADTDWHPLLDDVEPVFSAIAREISTIETLLVLGLFAIVLLIAIPQLAGMLRSYKINTAAMQVAMHIRFARNAAVKTKNEYRIHYKDLSSPPALRNTYRVEVNDGGWKQDTDLKGVLPSGNFELPSGVDIETGGMAQLVLDSRATPMMKPSIVANTMPSADTSRVLSSATQNTRP